jgi:hypothetical protein
MTADDDRDLLSGHLDAICEVVPSANVYGAWPSGVEFDTGSEEGIEAFGSWCFVEGFASALNVTATELLDEHGLLRAELPATDRPCPKCGGKLRPCSTGAPDYHCDACESVFEARLINGGV